jgi:hypothetical protein
MSEKNKNAFAADIANRVKRDFTESSSSTTIFGRPEQFSVVPDGSGRVAVTVASENPSESQLS